MILVSGRILYSGFAAAVIASTAFLSLASSYPPTDEEIQRKATFSIPLLKVDDARSNGAENRDLAKALIDYSIRRDPEDFSALTHFLDRYPQSGWRAGLLGNLGLAWRRSGHFQQGIDAFEQAWALTRNRKGRNVELIANWTVGELAHMHSHLGHEARIRSLYAEMNGTKPFGPATEQWTTALEALARKKDHPEAHARCGPMALASILRRQNRDVPDVIFEAPASPQGFSMTALAQLANRAGIEMQPIKRTPGSTVPVPSVAHWKVDHYSAIIDQRLENGRSFFLVENPLFEERIWVSRESLDAETSGYFLAPAHDLDKGWRAATSEETGQVWGRCWNGILDLLQTMLDAVMVRLCSTSAAPMADYNVHAMLVSLHLEDTPVGYNPPIGPPVRFQVVYNQREAGQPAIFSFSNLGPKWTFNWMSYVTDMGPLIAQNVTVSLRGGGQEKYIERDRRDPSLGINYQSQAELLYVFQRNDVIGYERRLPDGSKEVFGLAEPLSGRTDRERRIFLTEVIDPVGNSVKLTYDSTFRVVALTDAIGQVTRISYELVGDPLKITKVTDPFGRSATFAYNAAGRLQKITDVIGITSEFDYDGDFPRSLTTPYGVTALRTGQLQIPPQEQRYQSVNRWVEVTDPVGDTERVEMRSSSQGSGPQPTASTYYWDKQAWRAGGRNDANARMNRWMLIDATNISGLPWTVKAPLQAEVANKYTAQPPSGTMADHLHRPAAGADGRPIATERALEDGSKQTEQFEYNVRGHVTKSIDSAGRSHVFDYDTNGIDLLEVRNEKTGDRLARIGYNSQHLPVTVTDAALQTTRFTYNSRGQVLSVINAKNETTAFSYDARGYLIAVTGPVRDTVAIAYDGFGRVQTVTDPEGYRLVYAYDALDRPTQVTYPDGTVEQIRYNRLDAETLIDRRGRQSMIAYDALRRPVSISDALGRVTRMSWCGCGGVEQLTDPAGNVTAFVRDLRGRLVEKTLPDGARTRFVYSPQSGRLAQMIDPKGQTTTYEYTADGNVRRIAFENATLPTAPISLTYDANYPRLTRVEDGIGVTTLAYQPARSPGALQLASVTGPVPGSRLDYGYDELGRLTSRSINGVAATVVYDALGRQTSLRNALGEFRFAYAGASARLASLVYPNGQKALRTYYDVAGGLRLRQIRNERADGSLLSQFDYEYESTGEIRLIGRTQPELQPALTAYGFRYDDAGQLISGIVGSEDGSVLATHDYAYDAAANRTLESVSGDVRAAAFNGSNQLVSLQQGETSRGFSYDSNGNLLGDGVRSFEWDARDRLVAVTIGDHRTEFAYDGFDRRVRVVEKELGQTVGDKWLLWCGDSICEERTGADASTVPVKRLFSFGEITPDGALFYTRDHLSSVRQLTTNDGRVAGSFDYEPWGRTVNATSDREPSFGFTGHWRHTPSGLLLARYRAYDPELGRWLSRDPIAEDGGVNLYQYASADPVRYTDPNGLEPQQQQPSGWSWITIWAVFEQFRKGLDFAFRSNEYLRPPANLTTGAGIKALPSWLGRLSYPLSTYLILNQIGADKKLLAEAVKGGSVVDQGQNLAVGGILRVGQGFVGEFKKGGSTVDWILTAPGKGLLRELQRGGCVADKLLNPPAVQQFWEDPIGNGSSGLINWLSAQPSPIGFGLFN